MPTSINGIGQSPITAGTLNAHQTIIFNGTDQYAENTTFTVDTPFTFYLVLRQITHTDNDVIVRGQQSFTFKQQNPSPDINLTDPSGDCVSSQLLINTWGVLTLKITNPDNFLRVGLNSEISALNDDPEDPLLGLWIGSDSTPLNFSNIEVAYIIVRDRADSTSKQNAFINFLKTRFAI